MRVLVVEDEPRMSTLLQRGFCEEGYAVDVAGDGTDGLWLAMEQDYPTRSSSTSCCRSSTASRCAGGFGRRAVGRRCCCSPLRQRRRPGPRTRRRCRRLSDQAVQLRRARSPRVRALVRRRSGARPALLEVGDLRVDPATHRAWRAGVQPVAVAEGDGPAGAAHASRRRRGQPNADLRPRVDFAYHGASTWSTSPWVPAEEDRPSLRPRRHRDSARRRVSAPGRRGTSRCRFASVSRLRSRWLPWRWWRSGDCSSSDRSATACGRLWSRGCAVEQPRFRPSSGTRSRRELRKRSSRRTRDTRATPRPERRARCDGRGRQTACRRCLREPTRGPWRAVRRREGG